MSIYYKIKRTIASLSIKKTIHLNALEPIVSFTFDDAPDSAFIKGAAILKKYGYNGTYYISMGLRHETEADRSYFDYMHLSTIVKDGGELGCHTFNHIPFYTSSKDQIRKDLNENQRKVNEIIPGYRFTNFAYPYGQNTIPSKIIVRDTFASARGVQSGINHKNIDLLHLKGIALTGKLSLNEVFSTIERTIRLKGWLIFILHDVEPNPSPYGCEEEYFESVVKYCYERKIRVLTVEKMMQMIHAAK